MEHGGHHGLIAAGLEGLVLADCRDELLFPLLPSGIVAFLAKEIRNASHQLLLGLYGGTGGLLLQ